MALNNIVKSSLTSLRYLAGQTVITRPATQPDEVVVLSQLQDQIQSLNLGQTQAQVDAAIAQRLTGAIVLRGEIGGDEGPMAIGDTAPQPGWAYRINSSSDGDTSRFGFEPQQGDLVVRTATGWFKIDAVDATVRGTADEIEVVSAGDLTTLRLAPAVRTAVASIALLAQNVASALDAASVAVNAAIAAQNGAATAKIDADIAVRLAEPVKYLIDTDLGDVLSVVDGRGLMILAAPANAPAQEQQNIWYHASNLVRYDSSNRRWYVKVTGKSSPTIQILEQGAGGNCRAIEVASGLDAAPIAPHEPTDLAWIDLPSSGRFWMIVI